MTHLQEKFTELIEKIAAAFFILDKNGNYKYVKYKRAHNYQKPDDYLLGKNIWEELPEMKELNFRKAIDDAMASQQYVCLEEYIPTYNNWFEIHVHPSQDDVAVCFLNITEKKEAQQTINKVNDLYLELIKTHNERKATLNRINDGVVSLDKEWRYTFLNDAALDIHTDGRDATIGRIIWDVHPGMRGTIFWDKYHEAMETGKVVEFENYYPLLSTWFYMKIYPSSDGLTIFYRDITEYKKAEETLNQNTLFIESIINASPDIIYIFDIVKKESVYANDGLEKNLGYSVREVEEMGNQVLSRVLHPDDLEFYLENVYPKYAIIKDKEIISNEYRLKNKNGDFLWFLIKESIFLRDKEGIPQRIFGIASDITNRKKGEQELLEMNNLLRNLSEHLQKVREEERTSVAREIHDELGQQLTVMKMDVSWLDKKLGKEDGEMRNKLEDLKNILDQTVKTVRRIASDLRPSMLDDMGLSAAIEWQLAEFGKRSGLKTEYDGMPEELPLPDLVKTGLFRITQESLTNIGRYAKADSVKVKLYQQEGKIVLMVKDNGLGFDKEKLIDKKTFGILGMKERTAMIGGSFEIDSCPGKGTTVIASVPFEE